MWVTQKVDYIVVGSGIAGRHFKHIISKEEAMNRFVIDQLLQQALCEDIGHEDITTNAIFGPKAVVAASIIVKNPGRLAGLDVAKRTFQLLEPTIEFTELFNDGADVEVGQVVAYIHGNARAILSGERVALNLLQRMSGIATQTREVCRIVSDLNVQITDTRKTMPELRVLDKYAVEVGGGKNHRFGLFDAVMIKDNHIAAAGSISTAVSKVRQKIGHMVKVELEVDTIEQVKEALELDIDIILLDNMSPALVKDAVQLISGRFITEASGGITPQNIRDYGQTGVDVISIGWLTHSVKALDISLDIQV